MVHLALNEVDDEHPAARWGDHVTDAEGAPPHTPRTEQTALRADPDVRRGRRPRRGRPRPHHRRPTDALVRVTYACVCGSDLHPYHDLEDTPEGRRMGHEAIGVVEEVGADVTTLRVGDTVIVPFAWSDGTCAFCRDGITTSCVHGGFFDGAAVGHPGRAAAASRRPTAPPSSSPRGPTSRSCRRC